MGIFLDTVESDEASHSCHDGQDITCNTRLAPGLPKDMCFRDHFRHMHGFDPATRLGRGSQHRGSGL